MGSHQAFIRRVPDVTRVYSWIFGCVFLGCEMPLARQPPGLTGDMEHGFVAQHQAVG